MGHGNIYNSPPLPSFGNFRYGCSMLMTLPSCVELCEECENLIYKAIREQIFGRSLWGQKWLVLPQRRYVQILTERSKLVLEF